MDYEYEDLDEDGLPLQKKKPWRENNFVPMRELRNKVFFTVFPGNRKYFADVGEQKKWRQITKSLERGRMSQEWFDHCLEMIADMNKKGAKITFARFLVIVLNIVKQKEWEAIHIKLQEVELVHPEEVIHEREDEATSP